MISLSSLTLEELRSLARQLTAAGYPVVLDDGVIWERAVSREAWRKQLEHRVRTAWALKKRETPTERKAS